MWKLFGWISLACNINTMCVSENYLWLFIGAAGAAFSIDLLYKEYKKPVESK